MVRFGGYLKNSVITDWERLLPYIPFFAYNYVASTLTYSEFEIYQSLKDGISQAEIAIGKGISEAAVSEISTKLREIVANLSKTMLV